MTVTTRIKREWKTRGVNKTQAEAARAHGCGGQIDYETQNTVMAPNASSPQRFWLGRFIEDLEESKVAIHWFEAPRGTKLKNCHARDSRVQNIDNIVMPRRYPRPLREGQPSRANLRGTFVTFDKFIQEIFMFQKHVVNTLPSEICSC